MNGERSEKPASAPAGSASQGTAGDLDALVRELIALGAEIAGIERQRDIEVQFHARQAKEAAARWGGELAHRVERRDALRAAILEAWPAGETTLDLPSGKVSRRNYRDLTVQDRTALLYALDQIDRLDLVTFVFDGPAVARLIAEGALPDLPPGAATVVDQYNLQVRPKNAPGANVGRVGRPGAEPGGQPVEIDHAEDRPEEV